MKNYIYTFRGIGNLTSFLSTSQMQIHAKESKSMLIQIFSSQSDMKLLKATIDIIEEILPQAIIVGSTTVGEIAEGCLQLNTIVLSVSFFHSTLIHPILKSCSSGEETITGKELIQNIYISQGPIAGVLLLATPLHFNLAAVFQGMLMKDITFPVFGGGAGVYDSSENSLIFCGNHFLNSGIIAVVFLSDQLQIYANSHLGWQPLTKEMTVTESDGMLVKTVDHMPAFHLYNRYLNIKEEDEFFLNVLEFPFLLERNGYTVARVPFFLDEEGSIKFVADVAEGEKFRIGYGDPELIVNHAKLIQKDLHEFKPEAIFIYACICRRFLMQNDVNLEIVPFQSIANTAGFYTYGEFLSHRNKIELLNSTTVVVGMREGKNYHETDKENNAVAEYKLKPMVADPFSEKHNQIISRLFHFITVLSQELEQANNELIQLSEIDKLTQICNRMKLDKVLTSEIKKSQTFHTVFSVILLDIDKFKSVNDTHGHITGDEVLVDLANILKSKVRKTDTVGRWGGEEFLLVLPLAELEQACAIAEKIRSEIYSHVFPARKHLTCSFGVASYNDGDNDDILISRADKALYQAKDNGRNRVEFIRQRTSLTV